MAPDLETLVVAACAHSGVQAGLRVRQRRAGRHADSRQGAVGKGLCRQARSGRRRSTDAGESAQRELKKQVLAVRIVTD